VGTRLARYLLRLARQLIGNLTICWAATVTWVATCSTCSTAVAISTGGGRAFRHRLDAAHLV
jgi:hypothetical protein